MRTQKTIGLLEIVDRYNAELFKVIPSSSQYPYKTLRRYVSAFLSLSQDKTPIMLSNAGDKMLGRFQRFLGGCGYSARTVERNRNMLRRIIDSVNTDGVLAGSIATRKYSARLDCLTHDELVRILAVKPQSARLQRVRDVFLFSCFTGLRYDDLRELTDSHLSECKDGRECLVIPRRMTGMISYIPLLYVPQLILDRYFDWGGETLLPCITNERMNYYLKQIGEEYGLSKKLYCTVARNTFASTVAYAHGMSMECISRVMGDNGNPSFEHITQEEKDSIEAEFKTLENRLEKYTDVFVI